MAKAKGSTSAKIPAKPVVAKKVATKPVVAKKTLGKKAAPYRPPQPDKTKKAAKKAP